MLNENKEFTKHIVKMVNSVEGVVDKETQNRITTFINNELTILKNRSPITNNFKIPVIMYQAIAQHKGLTTLKIICIILFNFADTLKNGKEIIIKKSDLLDKVEVSKSLGWKFPIYLEAVRDTCLTYANRWLPIFDVLKMDKSNITIKLSEHACNLLNRNCDWSYNIPFNNLLLLNSYAASKLYPFLKMYESSGEIRCDHQKMKTILNSRTEYEFSQFKLDIILPAVEEINKKLNMGITFETIDNHVFVFKFNK